MSLLGFACAAALVPLGLAAAWRRANWRYGLASLAAVAGLAANVLGGKFPSSSGPALLDIPLILAAFVLAAEAIGLPDPVGRRLGFGLHSPEWEFDRRLVAAIGRFNQDLERAQRSADGSNRRQATSQASLSIKRIRELRAPDEDWQSLAELYAQICDLKLQHLTAHHPDAEREIDSKQGIAARRHENLRSLYRERPLYLNRR
jgi:hypothetical protein